MNPQARKAKIGLMQIENRGPGRSVGERQNDLLEWCESSLKDGADLVFMPEGYQYMESRDIPRRELAEEHFDAFAARCAALAAKYGAYVASWDFRLSPDGTSVSNAVTIYDRQGREAGCYRKVHLTWREYEYGLTPGEAFPVFALDIGKVGVQICFDHYFPEAVRMLALQGAELVLYPYFGDTMPDKWEAVTRARAFENGVYVAPCSISRSTFTGLVDPSGDIVAKVERRGTTQVVEIDLGKRHITRTSALPGQFEDFQRYLWKTRRPPAYRTLTERLPVSEWEDIRIYEP